MEAFIALHGWPMLFCFIGWLSVILYACESATRRRQKRVWPWNFFLERPMRVLTTACFAAMGYAALIEFDMLSSFWAALVGASSESTAELFRAVSRTGFLKGLIEKRTGVKIEVTDEDRGGRLSDTTVLGPQETMKLRRSITEEVETVRVPRE